MCIQGVTGWGPPELKSSAETEKVSAYFITSIELRLLSLLHTCSCATNHDFIQLGKAHRNLRSRWQSVWCALALMYTWSTAYLVLKQNAVYSPFRASLAVKWHSLAVFKPKDIWLCTLNVVCVQEPFRRGWPTTVANRGRIWTSKQSNRH